MCIFTQKWLDHLLLMTSYLVTIVIDHHLTFHAHYYADILFFT